jgi:ferredoxin
MAGIDAGRIKEMVLSEGIDLVGVADARELILAYPPRPATALLPEARSVIVMAVAHSIGAARTEDIKLWTRNKMETSRLLDRTAEKLGRFLESTGFLTLPVSAEKPVEIHKRDPQTGEALSSHPRGGPALTEARSPQRRHGADRALEPAAHTGVRPAPAPGGIITEAALEPDLCPEGYRKCEQACPVGALDGGTYEVDPCFNYWSMGLERMRPRRPGDLLPFMRMLYENLLKRDLFIELGQTCITDVDFCIECMKACPVGDRPRALSGRHS